MSGENTRLINIELTLNATMEEVWDAWTTEKGITSFFAPACNIDMKIDGMYEIYFFPEAKEGLRGADGMRVMALEKHKMLSFSWNQTPDLSIRPQRTLVSIKFYKESETQTRLNFCQSGWGDGPEWDKAYAYFKTAWKDVVLFRLQHRFNFGTVDWNDPPKK